MNLKILILQVSILMAIYTQTYFKKRNKAQLNLKIQAFSKTIPI